MSGVGHRFDSALPADANQTNRSDDLVSRVEEVLGLHPSGCPLLPDEPQELPDSLVTAKDKGVKGPPRQVIHDFRVEDAVVHLATSVEVLVATPHYLHISCAIGSRVSPAAYALPMAGPELSRGGGRFTRRPPNDETPLPERGSRVPPRGFEPRRWES
jgi:hypothetical protein